MLAGLKEQVWKANLELIKSGLVVLTWGNASGLDRIQGIMAIKPSGVPYGEIRPSDMVLVALDGTKVEGKLNPSSDTPTHLELYKAFAGIGGIVHAHSEFATMFAQAGREIPCLGTTHADIFYGAVPVTRSLRRAEVIRDYERNTGRLIVERFKALDPAERPGVLVADHGPFCWGRTAADAVEHGLALERIAKLAWGTLALGGPPAFPRCLLDKHFQRKHGPGAYYGQKKGAQR